ncbi:DUF2442 domain-containing protein [Mariniphaga sp.]|uniref:DUF2442 domain-containing protein n=1 Tax=Mariniphaga sp. TaxID=1954475 RepID=UPI00356950C1
MKIELRDVKPSSEYTLLLVFNNGETRKLDMKPYLELELYRELKNKKIFNTVKKSFDTIQWDNEADFDPDILYEKSTPYITK